MAILLHVQEFNHLRGNVTGAFGLAVGGDDEHERLIKNEGVFAGAQRQAKAAGTDLLHELVGVTGDGGEVHDEWRCIVQFVLGRSTLGSIACIHKNLADFCVLVDGVGREGGAQSVLLILVGRCGSVPIFRLYGFRQGCYAARALILSGWKPDQCSSPAMTTGACM